MKADRSTNRVAEEFKKDDANCEKASKEVTLKSCGDKKIRTTKIAVNDGSAKIQTTIVVEEYKKEDTNYDNVISTKASFTDGEGVSLSSLTEGTCYTFAPDNDVIWWYIDGDLRKIPNNKTFQNIFNDDSEVTCSNEKSSFNISDGVAIQNGAILIQGHNSDAIYLLTDSEKCEIVGSNTFKVCSINVTKVVRADDFIIDSIDDGSNIEVPSS